MYKPDSFYLTAHLWPPPSHRFIYKQDVQLLPSQSLNDSNGATTPSGRKNWVRSVWTFLMFFLVSNFVWESGQYGLRQG